MIGIVQENQSTLTNFEISKLILSYCFLYRIFQHYMLYQHMFSARKEEENIQQQVSGVLRNFLPQSCVKRLNSDAAKRKLGPNRSRFLGGFSTGLQALLASSRTCPLMKLLKLRLAKFNYSRLVILANRDFEDIYLRY